jgi:hypothetical protein
MSPKCYHKRRKPILKVALIHYGHSMSKEDLNRIAPLLIKRFSLATNSLVEIDIVDKKIIPLKQKMPAHYRNAKIKDPKRLHRLWYYDKMNTKVIKEVYEVYKNLAANEVIEQLDVILATTSAQFDSLGFANGRVSITEYPMEVFWNDESGGRTEYPTDYRVVDELIHELGHNMFIGHASTKCSKPAITLQQRRECCEMSPNRDDVMSYCRDRRLVDENFMYGFEDCHRRMIEELIVPSMLAGKRWNVSGRVACQ